MKIAICDDDTFYVNELKNNLNDILVDIKVKADIHLFTDSSILFNNNIVYDLAFIDIEMPKYSGIDIARKLKAINSQIIVFFITSYDHYLDEAMDLNIFRYISKPLDSKRLKRGVIKAFEVINSTTIKFNLKKEQNSKIVSSSDIIYVETIGRYTKVVTNKEEFVSSNKIDFWEEKLIASFFYKVHKSFIVNLKYLTNYKRDTVTLLDKYDIPISYRKQADFRGYFLDFFGGRLI